MATFLVGFRILEVESGPKGTSNETCADCHRSLYREWQASGHAGSYTSPLFQKRTNGYARKDCLPCHVPVTSQQTPLTTRTWSMDTGVDCVSCHVLRDAVRGPYDVDSAHRAIQDPRFLDNRACQQCHGNTVLEAREAISPFNTKTCQSCHMPIVKRHLASGLYQLLRKKKKSGRHDFNLTQLLRGAAKLSLGYDSVSRTLAVTVENVGAGHKMPTGSHGAPTVKLVVFLEESEPGRPVITREMAFSNRDGTAISPKGAGTLEIPIRRAVPVSYTAHARLLFFGNDEVTRTAAEVMAQQDYHFEYYPPPPEY